MRAEMDGRDPRGRFKRGWKGGPGRPPRPTERRYVGLVAAIVTDDVWADIVRTAVEQAGAGDAAARNWLTALLCGKDPPKLSRLTADDAPPPDDTEDKGETADEGDHDAEAAADAVLRDIWQKADAETVAACERARLLPADPNDPNDDETKE